MTAEEEKRVERMLEDLVGAHASAVMELLGRFEDSHPRERPHYYLSLLGTHPRHRGKGYGMALLEENLRRIDDEGIPAYLESSNPDNDRRYEKLGFARTGAFSARGAEQIGHRAGAAEVDQGAGREVQLSAGGRRSTASP